MINFILSHWREIVLSLCSIGFAISCIGIGWSLGDIIWILLYGEDDDK